MLPGCKNNVTPNVYHGILQCNDGDKLYSNLNESCKYLKSALRSHPARRNGCYLPKSQKGTCCPSAANLVGMGQQKSIPDACRPSTCAVTKLLPSDPLVMA